MLRDFNARDTLALAILVVGFLLLWASSIFSQGEVTYLPTYEKKWVRIKHESGSEYIIRTDTVLGFYEPQDGRLRNEILLSGGHNISTEMTPDEFAEVLVEDKVEVKKLP